MGKMRIKQLELLGFKSFKNKTALSFPAGITAIVGPNGCGKSNVIDALRWVLGEQSPRHLRGQEMSDVVFAGNESSSPLGMAEVNLLLENDATDPIVGSSSVIGTQWSEMMVSRRYFRSGESEYSINKVPCRLRDIVEFFLGTGAGTKAYSIIEQGRVDHLINAKPEEIRLLIEEAAGVSLFRSRRLAAERKMERTQENLSRVADLLREMDRQLGSLRRQAKKAEQYRTLQEEFKAIDLSLLCRTYRVLSEELAALDSRREELRQHEERLVQEEQRIQTERAETLAALSQEESALHEVEEHRRTLESSLRQGEQRKQFLIQQEQRATARVTTAEEEITGLTNKMQQVSDEIVELDTRATEIQHGLQEDETFLRTYEQEIGGLQQSLREREARAEEIKSDIVNLLTQEAQLQNALSYARRRAAEVEQRLQTLARETERVGQLRAETELTLTTVQGRAAAIRERLTVGQRQRAEMRDGLRETLSTGEQIDGELTAAWAKQAELRARLATLEELEQGYDHYSPGVKSIMAGMSGLSSGETESGIYGVVAQMVDVPREYERAVAAVLRDKLEYVMVADAANGLTAVEYLRGAQAGRGSFIPLSPKRLHGNGHGSNGQGPDGNGHRTHGHLGHSEFNVQTVGQGTSLLIDLVTVDSRYREVAETLLGDAVLVSDLRSAMALWQKSEVHHTFVTRDGEVITAQGIISGGSEGSAQEALLERRREIRDLRDARQQHESVVSALVLQRQDVKKKQQEIEGEITLLETEAHTLGQESEALQREEGKLEGEHRRLLDKYESVTYEQQMLESEMRTLRQEIAQREAQETTGKTTRVEREAALTAAQEEVARVKVGAERQRVLSDEVRVRAAERRERLEGMRGQRKRIQDRQRELTDRHTVCHKDMQSASAEIERVRGGLAELAELLVQNEADLALAMETFAMKQSQCVRLREHSRTAEVGLEQLRTTHLRTQEEKAQVDIASAEKRVAREHSEATVLERYETGIVEILEQYPELPGDQGEIETQRQDLREKIVRLGEVNPGAAAELAQEEERYTFLKTQEHDLQHSLQDLQNTITKLNRESRERFRDTFELVDAKFREMYANLVEGGKAHIALTDTENLAESGVEIAVQPPGKRLRSLQLLSGGEKALAALSLTFALFLIRPSPFCVLDEVDAPLDDANVGRFNQLVHEMSATTQIILVTHNKRTMEAASTLYGVTMQEAGVSTIVSVSMS
ncbi:MAG: chromosome segregation protein SMC [Deltaproteobacteria bacterium]|nr:chromosome segregation protein SMC [Deltaproteobacteria bacterium]